jgi:Na+-transporting NADH:ubiquinone oxidoreductase subunit NqrB
MVKGQSPMFFSVDVISLTGDTWIAVKMANHPDGNAEQMCWTQLTSHCQEHAEAEAVSIYKDAIFVNDIQVKEFV